MNISVPPSVYAQRRAHLAAQLGEGGIAIIPTAQNASATGTVIFFFATTAIFIT